MKNIEDDKFKSVIRLGEEGTQLPADFTQLVMQTIEADTARELALKSVLQRHPAEGPAMDFTASVMAQISKQHTGLKFYKPIITRKAWLGIAAVITFFIGMVFLADRSANAPKNSGVISSTMRYVSAIPTVYVLAFVMMGVLALADYLITERSKKRSFSRLSNSR